MCLECIEDYVRIGDDCKICKGGASLGMAFMAGRIRTCASGFSPNPERTICCKSGYKATATSDDLLRCEVCALPYVTKYGSGCIIDECDAGLTPDRDT